METIEHTHAGNQIIADFAKDNLYLQFGHYIEGKIKPLEIGMMRIENGLPQPTGLTLKAGEILALAGDYFTKPGWGLSLQIPEFHSIDQSPYQHSAAIEISGDERTVFHESYATLTAPNVDRKLVDKIYEIDKDFSDNPSTFNQYITQIKFMSSVPHYLNALKSNEAHFAPWSTRAYVVGHATALEYAKRSHELTECANGNLKVQDTSAETQEVINKIRLAEQKDIASPELLHEYAHRYYALAVSMDLSAMHYYSDHFAGGHLNRIGLMRKSLSDKYGFIGQTLVNSMHNEDNDNGVFVKHGNRSQFQLPDNIAITNAEGDGTYDKSNNDENANDLIDGMTASIGEIYTVGTTGQTISPKDYEAATTFLPEVDLDVKQYQPMFVLKENGDIYFRKNIATAYKMQPDAYKELLKSPESFTDQYEKLSMWKAIKLFIRLRVATLIPYFWPNPKPAAEGSKVMGINGFEQDDEPVVSSHSQMIGHGLAPTERSSNEPVLDLKEDSTTTSHINQDMDVTFEENPESIDSSVLLSCR